MIAGSVAYAELRQRSLAALGTSRRLHNLDLGTLLAAYESAIVKTATGFEVDVFEDEVQAAWIGDVELAYDRAISQASTFGWLLTDGRDPLWIAVTGYYAAFFSCKALLTMTGSASRAVRLPVAGITGLHHIYTKSSTYVGRITVTCDRIAQDSHRATWRSLRRLLQEVMSVETSGTVGLLVLAQIDDYVYRPTWLSDFRNVINYSVDVSPRGGSMWASTLRSLDDVAALEGRLITGGRVRDEQRTEMVMLTCCALMSSLYGEYLDRAARPDRRLGEWRDAVLSDLPMPIRTRILGRC